MLKLLVLLQARLLGLADVDPKEERGDVPGWVLVTAMTVGLVLIVYTIASAQLRSIITSAFNKVKF